MVFDPNKPFKTLDAKPAAKKFDPSKPFKTVSEPEADTGPSQLESAYRGAKQGITLGFSDELAGAGKGMLDDFKELLGMKPASGEKPKFDELGRVSNPEALGGDYTKYRDESRELDRKAREANPLSYLGGSVAGGMALPGSTTLSGAAALGALGGLGSSDADNDLDLAKSAAMSGALGAATQGAGMLLGKGLDKLSSYAGKGAENLAKTATGATGKQLDKFDDNAGRELLDRGIVTFGATPGKIASRAQSAIDDANQNIGGALSELSEQGVNVKMEQVIDKLTARMKELEPNLAEDKVRSTIAKQVRKMYERAIDGDQMEIPIDLAEHTKRGFDEKVNWNTVVSKPKITQGNKAIADAYRSTVEETAKAANPALAQQFKQGKETYGLMKPILEAASRRDAQLNQIPIAGLLDVAAGSAAGMGALIEGDFVGAAKNAVVGALARRLIGPRAASTGAVTLDNLSKFLQSGAASQMGQYGQVLMNAATRGKGDLLITHNFLVENDPEYKARLENIARGQ